MYEHLSTDSDTIRSAVIDANQHSMKTPFGSDAKMAC